MGIAGPGVRPGSQFVSTTALSDQLEDDVAFPKVCLNDELMREGMQIESVDIPLASKVKLLNALSASGLIQIEVGSFVSPRYTPQMADIDTLVSSFTPREGVRYTALALNQKGRDRMTAHMPPLSPSPIPLMTYAHLCDTFVRRNANMSQKDEIANWPRVVQAAVDSSATEAGIGVGAAWGSNFEGPFSLEQRMDMLARQHDAWADSAIPVTWVSLADPMSWCMPDWVEEQLTAITATWPHITNVHLHLHNARGMALPSIYAAIRALDDTYTIQLDVVAGGIGGCPYCGNGRATGMAATEDVVHMLETMGISTGVDLDKLIDAVWLLEDIIGRATPGHVSKAGPRPDQDSLYDPNLPLVETHDQARHFKLSDGVLEGAMRPWRASIPVPNCTTI
jgi:hydroxymethylglutaryl-CoA lyase